MSTIAEHITPSGGHIVVNPRSHATIHTYVAPEVGAMATSHIIEGAHGLVIVDAQFTPSLANEVKRYADGLGKPILRVVVSHRHADHVAGLQVFGDVPIYAPIEAQTFMQAHGQAMLDRFHINARAVVPTHTIEAGPELIDGVTYQYRLVHDAEAEVNLVIMLPDLSTIVAQDIVYNHVHLVADTKDVRGWRSAIAELQALRGYDLVLAGHGLPATPAVYGAVDGYLVALEHAYHANATNESARDELLNAFPSWHVAWLAGMSAQLAFASAAV